MQSIIFPSLKRIVSVTRIFVGAINREISFAAAGRIFAWMVRNLLSGVAVVLLGGLDALFYGKYTKTPVKKIVMIVGQPRSGTTFLHRKLAEDEENFLGVPHFFWRFPSITLYKFLRATGLLPSVLNRSYWGSRNSRAKLAARMHPHVLGHIEEDGIFLEERFWLHFFMFRRIPIPQLLTYFDGYKQLPQRKKDNILKAHQRVLKKWLYLQKEAPEHLILKENDAIDFVEDLVAFYGIGQLIFLGRHPQDFMNSFIPLSVESTFAKTGIDPRDLEGWWDVSVEKRYYESARQIELVKGFTGQVVPVHFKDLTRHTSSTIKELYAQLGLPMGQQFWATLQQTESSQKTRAKGYQNEPIAIDMEAFAAYHQYLLEVSAPPVQATAPVSLDTH